MYTRKGRRSYRSRECRSRKADFVREFSRKCRRDRVSEAIESKDIFNKYVLFGRRKVLLSSVARSARNATGEVSGESNVR